MNNENVLYVFVGSTYKPSAKPTDDGQIGINFSDATWGDGTGGTTSGKDFRIAKMNSKGVLEFSPWIKKGTQLKYNVSGYAAPVADVWTLTALDAVEKDELKSIWLVIKDSLTTFGNKSMMKNAVYSTKMTAGSPDDGTAIALGLQNSFNKNMEREPEKYVTAVAGGADLVFTGQSRTVFEAGIWRDLHYTFELLGGDVGGVAHTAKGVPGKNTLNQIKEREWFAQGNRGYGYRVDVIPVASQLSSDAVYAALTGGGDQKHTYFQFKDQGFVNIVGQSPASLIEISTYLPDAESTKFNADLAAAFGV